MEFVLVGFLLSLRTSLPTLGFSPPTLDRPCEHRTRSYSFRLLSPAERSDDSPIRRKSRPERGGADNEWHHFAALESPTYDERKPRRISDASRERSAVGGSEKHDWGVEHHDPPPIVFPFTLEALTDAASDAIAASLYGQQKLDPNVVQNAMVGDTLLGRRPIRRAWDAGRVGVEIDGANYLFSSSSKASSMANGSAIRRVALRLAEKLSRAPWAGYETSITDDGADVASTSQRPVVLYFNQIKQALAASQELRLLRRQASGRIGDEDSFAMYSNVTIMCLGEGATIPKHLLTEPKVRRLGSKKTGNVNPRRGILIVVQPTDYNDEYRPPGPAVGAVCAFQRLAARALVEELPVVCLSPRYLMAQEMDDVVSSSNGGSWEQSGYQQSATYGGLEPPRGPMPWILRDFSPPVFCWVGNALAISSSYTTTSGLDGSPIFLDTSGRECYYDRLSLMQSVMNPGHAWHLFASKKNGAGLADRRSRARYVGEDTYQYLVSTKSASGRPTREVMRRLFGEFAPYK
jgi:hypothetical protein